MRLISEYCIPMYVVQTVADTCFLLLLIYYIIGTYSPVCSAAIMNHRELLVRCDQCIPGDETQEKRSMYRCVGCYQLFADAITARTRQVSKKAKKASFPLENIPVFKALLGTPWKEVAESRSIDEAIRLLMPVASVLKAYNKTMTPAVLSASVGRHPVRVVMRI
jgi:hypothetical protein